MTSKIFAIYPLQDKIHSHIIESSFKSKYVKITLESEEYIFINQHDAGCNGNIRVNNKFRQKFTDKVLRVDEIDTLRGYKDLEYVSYSIQTIHKIGEDINVDIEDFLDKIYDIPIISTHYFTFAMNACVVIVSIKSDVKGIIRRETKIIKDNAQSKQFNADDIVRQMSARGVRGLNMQIKEIATKLLFARRMSKEIADRYKVKREKGLILHGPPGTGKTTIARELMAVFGGNVVFKIVKGPELLSKWHGETEKNIRNLFNDALDDFKTYADEAPLHCIIIDEIDAICRDRNKISDTNGINDKIITQFLSCIDGIEQFDNIVIVGTTNYISNIDPAIRRPGRLGLHMKIDLANEEAREDIFRYYLESRHIHNVNCKKLAELSEGMSGADIENYVNDIVLEQLEKSKDLMNIVWSSEIFEIGLM